MVRKIFDFFNIFVVWVSTMRYIDGDGKIPTVQLARRHRVSENFKIDEEWEKL